VDTKIVLVVAGGDRPEPTLLTHLPPPMLTVAADSGVDHAQSLGLDVDVVVGDLDSAGESALEWARQQGAEIQVHPEAKDHTDLELAVEQAVGAMSRLGVDHLVVIGLGGGRLDHWLANALTLAGPLTDGVTVTGFVGHGRIAVVKGGRSLFGRPGELISLLPVGGPARGVTTSGLRYRLSDEDLDVGSSRGVSNRFDVGGDGGLVTATVTVRSGTLLAVQPHALEVDSDSGRSAGSSTTVPPG